MYSPFSRLLMLVVIGLGIIHSIPVYSNDANYEVKLIYRTFDSIKQTLSYLNSVKIHLSIDAILGAKVWSDQSSSLIRLLDYNLRNNFSLKSSKLNFQQLKIDLESLHFYAKNIFDKSFWTIFLKDPLYFKAIDKLLDNVIWSRLQCDSKSLKKSITVASSSKQTELQLNENLSDFCLSLLFDGCHISKFCWNLLVVKQYTGYKLAHQVLYLSVAKSIDCFANLTQLQVNEIDNKIQSLCTSIYQHNVDIEKDNFPIEDQDLFMENIAFCGFEGFNLFRNNFHWLEEIFKWQNDIKGCYQVDLSGLKLYRQSSSNRTKRRETIFVDGCSLHKSSTALASMSIFTQYLIMDLLVRTDPSGFECQY